MGVIGRLNQYGSMLAQEFDDYSMSENLFLYSEEFNQSSWINQGSVETTNTTATLSPFGLYTAEKLIGNNGEANRQSIYQSVNVVSGTTYTFSVFLKQAERRYATIWFDSPSITEGAYWGAGTFIDLQTGTIALGTQTKIVAYPNGWYRCYVTATPSFTGALILSMSIGTPNNALDGAGTIAYQYTGDGVSGFYIWGSQFETGTVVTNYTPTTTTIINRILSPTVNTNITGKAYTRQNLLTYSEQFNDASWSIINSSIGQNSVVAPDNSLTADKLIENNTNNQHVVYKSRTASNETVTFSVFCKAAERTKVWLQLSNFVNATAQAIYDLSTGTAGSPSANNSDYTNTSTSIIAYPNGWYRCILTSTKGSVNTTNNPSISTADASGNVIYLGDGTSGVYIWGAQLETSSVPSDYMKTTASTVTIPVAASTYFSSGFEENTGFTSTLAANVFSPYDPVYDDFAGTLFGPGQGRYMRQTSNKSAIVYNEIDEVSDFRDIVRNGLVLDLDAAQPLSYPGYGTTWKDLSGVNNNGTLVNSPTYNNSGYFDLDYTLGQNFTFANAASLQFLNVSPYTLEAWVYPTRNPGAGNYTGIFDREDSSTGFRDGYNLFFLGSATTQTSFITERFVASSNYNVAHYLDSSLSVNNWQHIVATYDGTTLSLYYNGVSVGTPVSTPFNISNTSKALTIGVRGGQNFGGRIANAKIYSKGLTATEVLKNFNALRHRFGI